ncbi:vicilin-like seed storage protein At2g28490 [Selaginella moellendorffii]|nr:vicilin-like seed storage protein At2g28490 [Selaginella moellendorffii]|eukprot:XP_002984436.2 vicilin-like seed storage protein At2g28490 [Selaginella moellendorffii]
MIKLLLLALAVLVAASACEFEYEDFILGEPVEYVKSDAGEIRALMGSHEDLSLKERDVALGFITMEPRALLLPHYMDASLVFYVQKGDAMIGSIRGESTVKKDLKRGDVYTVPAGAVFYVLNANEDEKLELIGIFDTSRGSRSGKLQSFFVGGGLHPKLALAGFRSGLLAAAFKVSEEEIKNVFGSQDGGPIIPTSVGMFARLKGQENYLESVVSNKKHKKDEDKKHKDDKKHKKDEDDKKHKDDDKKHKEDEDKEKRKDKIFNLFEKRAFENQHGWIASTLGEDVQALASGRIGVSIVKLQAGSFLAPHWNKQGAEFGVVTNGTGSLQVALPNGTNGVDAKLNVGTIFHVPQFFPASQIAATHECLEFVSFTVAADSRSELTEGIQFLAGRGSVLEKLELGILALSFNLPDHLVSSFLASQDDAAILANDVQ